MKTAKTITAILVAALLVAAAPDKYTEQMKKNIGSLYAAQTLDDYQRAINALKRVADAEKTRWEPYYYTALGYTFMASLEPDGGRKDALLDLATGELEKAAAIKPDDSETVTLEGFIHMIRVTVDTPTRGPKLSMMAVQSFSKAMTLDPNNPRAAALMAQMMAGTARFFNQEPTEACATAKKANELFAGATYEDNSLQPVWGKSMNDSLLEQCK